MPDLPSPINFHQHLLGASSIQELKHDLDHLESKDSRLVYLVALYGLLDQQYERVDLCVNHPKWGPVLQSRSHNLLQAMCEEGMPEGLKYMTTSKNLDWHVDVADLTQDMLEVMLCHPKGARMFAYIVQHSTDCPTIQDLPDQPQFLEHLMRKLMFHNHPEGLAALLEHLPSNGLSMMKEILRHAVLDNPSLHECMDQTFAQTSPTLQDDMLKAVQEFPIFLEQPSLKAHHDKQVLLSQVRTPVVSFSKKM